MLITLEAAARIKKRNRMSASLFAGVKLLGIVMVCLLYAGKYTLCVNLFCLDLVLLFACIFLCLENWKFANKYEGDF